MNISYDVEQEDLELAKRQNGSDKGGGRAALAALAAAALVLGWVALRGGFIVLYLAGLAVILGFWLWRRARGDGPATAFGSGQRNLALDEGGLREQAGDSRRHVSWRDVRRVASAEGHTFVYLHGSKPPVVIPSGKIRSGDYETFVRALYEFHVRHKTIGGR